MTMRSTNNDHDVTTSSHRGVETPRLSDVAAAGGGADAGPVAYTLRLSPDEALDLDDLMTELRRDTGQRRLEKSTVIKALVQLIDTDPHVRTALLDHLRR